MISRRSTKILAEFYHTEFKAVRVVTWGNIRKDSYVLEKDRLYGFLYENNFDPWLLKAAASLSESNERGLGEFIMRLHTGETVVPSTTDLDWDQRSKLGQRLIKDLAEAILNEKSKPGASVRTGQNKLKQNLISELELDGYIYGDGTLFFPEAAILDTQREEGILEKLCNDLKLNNPDTILHHLNLSHDHYVNERWDDSISNSRKVLESVLQEIASRHCVIVNENELSNSIYSSPASVRDYLEKRGLIELKEKEAIAKVYGLLSETGGHPYIAQKDQARLMRHLSLILSQFALLRLQGSIKSGEN